MTACEQFEILKRYTKKSPLIIDAGKINKAGKTGLIVEYNGVTSSLYDDDDYEFDENSFDSPPDFFNNLSDFKDWLDLYLLERVKRSRYNK